MDNEAKSSAVAIALKMWKAEPCRTWARYKDLPPKGEALMSCEHDKLESEPHNEPPPDLLSPEGADRLMTALRTEGLTICIGPRFVIIYDEHGTNLAESDMQFDKDHKPALLDAAWKVLYEHKS